MNSSDKRLPPSPSSDADTEASAVLAGEAGLPFQCAFDPVSGVDPFAEWLSLMEVVQMLCPNWPVRDQPLRGEQWRL